MRLRFWQWLASAGVTTALIVLAGTTAHSTIIITPRPDTPYMPDWVRLTEQDVDVQLTDRVAEVDVHWTYHNGSPHQLEGTFLFPLPPEAAVDRFSLYVDGEEIRAELLDADQARQEYQSIVRRMKDPALLEYAGRALLKARIFPIEPNADAKVRLQYTHPLTADFGVTDFVFPFTRDHLAPNAQQGLTAIIQTNTELKSVTSPTHDIYVEQFGSNGSHVSYEPKRASVGEDFHLLCSYDTRDLGAQFLTTVDDDGQGYFMALIAPGEVKDDAILPKDIVFCFDHSGSMSGEKIVQARDALRFCLNKLNAEDRFGLVVFNDRIDPFAGSLKSPTASEIRAAHEFVNRVEAEGGTNIQGALRQSLFLFEAEDRPKYLVFLTDGRPTVGSRDPQVIRDGVKEHNTHHARVFTFGVGHDLNAGLLNDLADDGRGQASYVAPQEDVEVSVSRFYSKIKSPVLADCVLEFEIGPPTGLRYINAVYPDPLPDLFAGSEAMVLGRFVGKGPVVAHLSGTRGNEKLNHTFETEFAPKDDRYAFIPKLWAARRIGFLLEEIRRESETPELKNEIVRLSKRHGIMTPYTAFLAAPEAVRHARAVPSQSQLRQGGRDNQLSVPPALDLQKSVTVKAERPDIEMDVASTQRTIDAAKLKGQGDVSSVQNLIGSPKPEESQEGSSIVMEGIQLFLREGIWTDWRLMEANASTDSVTITPYSDAYFKLTTNPQLAKILAVGEKMSFVWRNTVIVITEAGATEWNSDWNRLIN